MACIGEGDKCLKKSFKGVEGFLRRIAFNLGNSPSQTEVKIISCIPIDVTDLQQKIIHLERQLEEATCRKKPKTQSSIEVHTALTAPEYTPSAAEGAASSSASSPPRAAASPPPDLRSFSASCAQPLSPDYPGKNSTVLFDTPDLHCKDVETRRKNPFKRIKKPRVNSPMIYYTHTMASPFNNSRKERAATREMQRMDAAGSPPYVSDMLRKHYLPEMYFEEWTGSSQASAPVCRDRDRAPPRTACARDADACSCCHGCFYDLDRDHRPYRFQDRIPSTNMYHYVDSGNIYYNSSYYDIFPVKEKPESINRGKDNFKKWEPRIDVDNNSQDNCRTKIECRPVSMNSKISPAPQCVIKQGKFSCRRDHGPTGVLCANEPSRNTSVECGDIYMKRSVTKKRRSKQCKTVLLRNAECLTNNVNDTECQTESSKNLRPETTETPDDSQTESTLDQIKSILQSVLSHVKTNNQIKLQTVDRENKDAVVQKELQSGSPACSSLLNSYTYSPLSMDPCVAACSRAVPVGCCAPVLVPQAPAPSSHYKCMQNFPVFIQHTPTQRQCSACYRSRPEVDRHPIQTSTNTLQPAGKRSKETENLIKEIYKSLNIPIKRPSRSDYDDQKINVSRKESGEPAISNVMTMSRQVGRSAGRAVSTATSSTRSAPPARARASRSAATSAAHSEEDAESASASASGSEDTLVASERSPEKAEKKGIFKKMFGSVFRRRRKVKRADPTSTAAEESESDSDDYQTVCSQQAERARHASYAPAAARSRTRRSQRVRARRSPYMEQEQRRYWNEQLMFRTPPPKFASERAPSRPRSVRSRPPGIYFRKYEARRAAADAPGPLRRRAPVDDAESGQERPGRGPDPELRDNVSLKASNRKMSRLKRCAPKIKCADQWKRLVLEG